MNRREFVQLLAIASASGMNLHAPSALANSEGTALYDLPEFGNVNLLHYTDAHAQLLPVWFREPSFNLGLGDWRGKPPHLTGQHLLDHYGIAAGTQAIRDSGLEITEQNAERVGVMVGSGIGGLPMIEAMILIIQTKLILMLKLTQNLKKHLHY